MPEFTKLGVFPLLPICCRRRFHALLHGNTKFPNAGINTAGAKIGLVYNFNRTEEDLSKSLYQPVTTRFPRHISYDVVLFGSWRRKGVWVGEKQIASPNAYPVAWIQFCPDV